MIRWFEPVNGVQVGFVRAEEGECQELRCFLGRRRRHQDVVSVASQWHQWRIYAWILSYPALAAPSGSLLVVCNPERNEPSFYFRLPGCHWS